MNKSDNRYKTIAAWTIILFILYFIIGFIAVQLSLITLDSYFAVGGIIGGVVSVVGLLSFFRPQVTQFDVQKLQLESLRDIAESTHQLENLEKARLAAEHDINSLELRKQQMEVLVRKASLSLFLQEQNNLYRNKIAEAINRDNELLENLRKLADINAKLVALNEDIQKDENVDLLSEIIREAKKRAAEERTVAEFDDPLASFTYRVIETVANVIRSSLFRF